MIKLDKNITNLLLIVFLCLATIYCAASEGDIFKVIACGLSVALLIVTMFHFME